MEDTILNFHQYSSTLASGGQPTEKNIETLKNAGFEAILNISLFTTANAIAKEPLMVEYADMQYIHFPIDDSNLHAFHYLTFKGILNGLGDKKVFVHCGMNIKSSNLIHMYNVLENDVEEEESLLELKKIQRPDFKWVEYFVQMGMTGLR
ncbi:MAG: hypothetical protein WCG93_06850 [Paludibacter sp.]